MEIQGSYNRATIGKSFDDLPHKEKLKKARGALRCGCDYCQEWLKGIPDELIEEAKG